MTEARLYSHLDELMKDRKLTTTKLAKDAGVTERAISGLRRNAFVLVDSRTTARICEALGITPGDLFTVASDSQ